MEEVFVEVTLYELIRARQSLGKKILRQGADQLREDIERGVFLRQRTFTEEEWRQLLDWCENKARALIKLASEQLFEMGTRCPFCNFISPKGELINDLLDHIGTAHPSQAVVEAILGDGFTIKTKQGFFIKLQPALSP